MVRSGSYCSWLLWLSVVVHGFIWLTVVVICMVVSGYMHGYCGYQWLLWLSVVMHGYKWLYAWLLVVMRGYAWLSVFICMVIVVVSDYAWLSVVRVSAMFKPVRADTENLQRCVS